MYVIIKHDEADRLKEKLHHIKTAAVEVLDCIETACAKSQERRLEHNPEATHHRADYPFYPEAGYYPEQGYYPEVPVHHAQAYAGPVHPSQDMARRGRGRY